MTLTVSADKKVCIRFDTQEEKDAARRETVRFRILNPEREPSANWLAVTVDSSRPDTAELENAAVSEDDVCEVRYPCADGTLRTEYLRVFSGKGYTPIQVRYCIRKKWFRQGYTVRFTITSGKSVNGVYLKTAGGFPFCGQITDGTVFQCSEDPGAVSAKESMKGILAVSKEGKRE